MYSSNIRSCPRWHTCILLTKISTVPKDNEIQNIPIKKKKRFSWKVGKALNFIEHIVWLMTVEAMKKIRRYCKVMNCTELQKKSRTFVFDIVFENCDSKWILNDEICDFSLIFFRYVILSWDKKLKLFF